MSANSEDPDQKLLNAVSDLAGLHRIIKTNGSYSVDETQTGYKLYATVINGRQSCADQEIYVRGSPTLTTFFLAD